MEDDILLCGFVGKYGGLIFGDRWQTDLILVGMEVTDIYLW